MSGFEVVGVVLGGLPLVLEAAKSYRRGFEPLVKWKCFRKDFIKFIDTVDYEMKMFNSTLERFLLSVNTPEDELRKLMADPEYEGWKGEKLGKELRRKLGPSYEVYMSTMETMGKLMSELQNLLSLKDGRVDWAKPGSSQLDFQLKRIRICFRNDGTRTVEELGKLNGNLTKMLDANEKNESMRATRKDTSWGSRFQCIRRHASSLHYALRKSLSCDCTGPHIASLELEKRTTGDWSSTFKIAFDIPEATHKVVRRRELVASVRKEMQKADEILETIAISNQAERGQFLGALRHDFKSMSTPQVNVVDRPALSSSISATGPSVIDPKNHRFNSLSKRLVSGLKSGKPKVEKAVRMNVPPCVEVSHGPGTVCPPPLTEIKDQELELKIEIQDLCAKLRATDCDCNGYIAYEEQYHELRSHTLSNKTVEQDSYVTLDTMLRYRGEMKLSRRKRYEIASVLASSLLQLHSTPWLVEKIDKKNILFEKVGSDILVESPFVRCSFTTSKHCKTDEEVKLGIAIIRNAIKDGLRKLAIILLELCFGEPIETHHCWKSHLGQDGRPHESTDFLTALDWLDSVEDEQPGLEPIIDRCLNVHFEIKPDWNNTKFTQAVYTGVVEPLEKIASLG